VRELSFAVLAVIFFVALIGVAVRYSLRARRSGDAKWEELLQRLVPVDRDRIAAIAMDAVEQSGEPRSDPEAYNLDSSELWSLLGGLEGVQALEQNCAVLVELATYLQRWHPEALVVAEHLRLNAREIQWHVGRLKGAALTGNLQTSFADYAQRAAIAYYRMTRDLLELYDSANFPGLAELERAL
jgi:hypothetical protein